MTTRPASRPARLRTSALATLFVAAFAASAGFAAPAVADTADGPDVTWGVRTASNDHGDARENFVYEADPGQTIDDAIIVSNYDVVPVTLDVYAADGFTTTSGQLDVAARDKPPLEIGAWVVPAADRITVQPGESLLVPFTLTVPSNATPGDHAGGLLTTLTQPPVENGLTVDRRLGIRIHLRVGGALAPSLAIDDLHVDYAGTLNPFGTGMATVTYTVHNTGNVRLSAGQAVSLAGPFGMLGTDAATPDPVPELLPGETWPVTVKVKGVVPAFLLTATATLKPAAPEGADLSVAVVTATASTAAVPWTLCAIVLLLAAGIVLLVLRRRRARVRQKAREEALVQAAVEAALREREAAEASVPE